MSEQVKLSVAFIQSMPTPSKGRQYVRDADVKGLRLYITDKGSKSWYWVGRTGQGPQSVRLGAFPDMPISRARMEAGRINSEVAAGKRPESAAKIAASEMTLGALHRWYMEHVSIPHKASWKRDQQKFDRYWSEYRHHTLSQFTRADASHVHKTIGADRPSAANDALSFMSSLYKAAIADLNYQGQNPVVGIRKYHLEGRERFLSPDELAKFFATMTSMDADKHHRSKSSRAIFMLCLMTGARRGNVAAMRWAELDLKAGVWTVPAWKTKKKKTIAIVLIPDAVAIIEQQPKGSDFVFPSRKSKSGHMSYPYRAWEAVCESAELKNFRIHDLRRTFASYQAGLNVSLYTIAKTLGHGSIDSTAVYARLQLDAQRAAVELGTSEILRHGNPVNSVVGDKAGQSETSQDKQ